MGIRKYKPTSPGRRHGTVSDFAELTRSKPEKSLVKRIKKSGGRNHSGKTTAFGFANGGLGYGWLNSNAGGVLRGSGWYLSASSGVYTPRLDVGPSYSNTYVGFRCVWLDQ